MALILIIIIAAGFFGWSYYNSQNQNKPKPTVLSVEQIRDRGMAYIFANHTAAAQLIPSAPWIGGRQDTGLLGSETYLYSSGNWSLEIQYPVVPDPTYIISANYTSADANVSWTGTYNGVITETSQSFTIPNVTLSAPEQVRDAIMVYIQTYHNETASYMQNAAALPWNGGRTTPEGIVGSETYGYLDGGSAGWAVNIQYPVVQNPIYSVNATYSAVGSQIVTWQGTFEDGAVAETVYRFTP